MRIGTGWLFGLLVFSRLFVMGTIGSVPDMEASYVIQAKQLFETPHHLEPYVPPKIPYISRPAGYPPGYSALLYGINRVFDNWVFTSQAIYVLFSVLVAGVSYLIAKTLFDVVIARYTLAVMIFLPNLTAAVAGYSHTVVVFMFFLYLSVYAHWFLLLKQDTVMGAIGAVAGLAAASIRPEYVLYFLMFLLMYLGIVLYKVKGRGLLRPMAPVIIVVGIFLTGAYLHYNFLLTRIASARMTLFGDASYAYHVYVDTLRFRAQGAIDEAEAERLVAAAFGSPEENRYSILRAVMRNPREAMKNVLYNAKTLLKEMGHPLFMPVFLYPFIGIGLYGVSWREKWREHLFLAGLFLPCIAALMVFHVEIRYMSPLIPPLAMWVAHGIRQLSTGSGRYVVISLFAVLVCLFTAYAFHFKAVKEQTYVVHPALTP